MTTQQLILRTQVRYLGTKNMLAFSLVELMTVIVILGVLAAVGLPAYRNYVTRSKIAEGFSDSAAMKTAQISFFYERGNFVRYPGGFYQQGGKKYDVASLMAGGDFVANMGPAKLLGNPLGFDSGVGRFFSWTTAAGFRDSSGTAYTANYLGDGSANFTAANVTQASLSVRDQQTGNRCQQTVNLQDVGIQLVANEHWAVISGAADLTSVPTVCTHTIQVLRTVENEVVSSPIIVINQGE